MSNKGRLLKIKRMLAVMLAVILAFPNTGVAQSIGAGTVKAWANLPEMSLTVGSIESAYYINEEKAVTINPESGSNLVYAWIEAADAPDVPESGEYVNGEVWKNSASVNISGDDGDTITVNYAQVGYENSEGNKYTDSYSTGTVTFNIDTTVPEIIDISVDGTDAHTKCSDIAEDTETAFNRVVDSTSGTVQISVATDDDDNNAVSFSGAANVSNEGVVNTIGAHNDIMVTVTDRAGNTDTETISVGLWIQETVLITHEAFTYDGNAITSDSFTYTRSAATNSSEPTVSFSYDGNDAAVGLAPTVAGSYYVKADYELDTSNYSLPMSSGWVEFEIGAGKVEVTAPTKAEGRAYNGEALPLFTEGSAAHGTMYYGVATVNRSNQATYTTAVPERTEAGTYYLFYYAKGDTNYADTAKASLGSVIISKVDVNESSNLAVAYNGSSKEATLTATINKPTGENTAVPDGSVTFKYSTDDGNTYEDVDGDSVELNNGVAVTTMILNGENIYKFRAVYSGGTNYNEKSVDSETTVDLKGPELTTCTIAANGTNAGTITLNSDEAASVYYVVSTSELEGLETAVDVVNAAADTEAGYVIIGNGDGNDDLEASIEKTINLTSLDPDTTYYVAIVAKDKSGNDNYSEVKKGSFVTTAATTSATIDIDETNLKYGGTISATITDDDNKFANADSITWTWKSGDEVIATSVMSDHELTKSLELLNKDWYDTNISVSARISGYNAITDTTTNEVAAAALTPVLAGTFTKEYDNTTNLNSSSNEYEFSVEGIVGDDSVDVDSNGISFAYASAAVGTGINVTASNITALTGEDAAYYSLRANTATAERAGEITKVVLTAADVLFDEYDDYKLSKKTTDAAFTPSGAIYINEDKVVGSETVGLTSALTESVVTLTGGEWNRPGTPTATVTFTLNGSDKNNYTFKNADNENIDTVVISEISCTITGSVTLNLASLKNAINELDLGKTYDKKTDGGSITIGQTVGGNNYEVSLDYVYNSVNAGDVPLTFSNMKVVDDDGYAYEIANPGVLNGLNDGSVTGTINKIQLSETDILTNTNAAVNTISFTKVYDKGALTTGDVNPAGTTLTVATGVLEGDTLTASVTAISFTGNSDAGSVFDETGTFTITLGGNSASNYGFGDALTNTLELEGINGSITPKPLTFAINTTSYNFSSSIGASIKADILDNGVTDLVDGDNVNDLTIGYKDVEDNELDAITTDGTYRVYVTDTGNPNYSPQSTAVGTVTVSALNPDGATATVTNEENSDVFEYGETLTATLVVLNTPLAGKAVPYQWINTSDNSVLAEGTLTKHSVAETTTLPLDENYVEKTIKFVAKFDGYSPVESSNIEVSARTLTPTAIGGTATKYYDGNTTVTDTSNLTVAFDNIYSGDEEAVSIDVTAATFSDANVSDALTITATAFAKDGEKADCYRIDSTVASLTSEAGAGTITPVLVNSSGIVMSDNYYLTKKTSETSYSVGAGTVTFGTDPGVNGETVTLVPTLTEAEITLGSGESHDTAGTYNDAIVTYTMKVGDEVATNYSFSEDSSTQTTTLSGIKCVVIGDAGAIDNNAIISAITDKKTEDETALDKTYDKTNAGSVDVVVGDYKVTVDYTYAQAIVGSDLALTATDVTIVSKDDATAQYEITDEKKTEIIGAFATAEFKGAITPIVLEATDIIIGTSGTLGDLSFTKTYNKTALATTDTTAVLSVNADKIISDDTVTASISAIDFGDNAETVNIFTGTGTATITIDNTNYSFDDFTQNLTVAQVPGSITAKALDFDALADPLPYTVEHTGSNLADGIKANVVSKIKSDIVESGDSITADDLTLGFKPAEGDMSVEIVNAGTYGIYVTGITNGNYTYPSDTPLGSVSVIYGALSGTVGITGFEMAPAVGDTLTASYTGSATEAQITYTWVDGSNNTLSENSLTYTVAAADLSKTIKAVATDADGGYTGSVSSESTAAVAAKAITLDSLAPSAVEITDAAGLTYNAVATRTAKITVGGMEEGYYGEATLTFYDGTAGKAPTNITGITVKDAEGIDSSAYTVTYNGTIAEDLADTKIEMLTANDASAEATVYVGTAGQNPQTYTFTSDISAAITGVVGTPALGTVEVSGNGAQFIAENPAAAESSGAYTLTYALTEEAGTDLTENTTATITIPVTDGINYLQNIVLNLTLCPRTAAAVVITDVGTSGSVIYGNNITPTVTVDSSPATEHLTFSYKDTDGSDLTAAPTNVGTGYKVIAVYDDGTNYGVSSEFSFNITPATLNADSFTLSSQTSTIGGSAPTVSLAGAGLSLGEGATTTVKYSLTSNDAAGAVEFGSIDEEGTYYVYVTTSGATNYTDATVELASTITISKQSTPTPPEPGPSDVAVTGISLDKTSATLLLSENKIVELTATVAPSDATNKGVNWTVSPAGVVTLSASTSNSGTAITVTAVKEGTATVTATAAGDATKSATATITVNGEAAEIVEVTGISISPATVTVEEKGTTRLTAVFAPENQTENPEVTWTSSDATIATVDSTGKVTGVKEGSATITAKVTGIKGEFSATSAVTVTKKIVEVNSISLSTTMLTVKKGTSAALTATVLPADATDPSVTWTSGDSAIATVENGTVTGVKAGTTSISAKAGNQTAVAIVTVTEDDAEEEEEQEDLSDLIKDTEDGKKLPDVIKDVIENTEDGTVTNIWVGGLESSYTYTGSAIKPVVHVYDGVRQLAEKTDYTVSYKDNKNAGTSAKIIIKFKGNYNTTPEQTVNFTIAPIDLAECEIPDVAVKEKSAPKFSVIYAGKAQPAKAYNVSYDTADIKKAEAGEYTATFTAKDTNYTGTNTCTVTVIGKNDKNRDLANAKIKLSSSKPTWTGEAIEPSVTVTDAGGKTVDPSLYEVSYQNNVDPGKAMVIVTANDSSEGGYVGAKTATFNIVKGKTGGIEISIDESVEYSAAGAQAAVTVTDSDTGEVLKKGVDYTVKYSNNKAVTTAAEAKIKGKGNYKFNETKTFAIVAKDIADVSFAAADVVGANKWNKSKLTITDGGKNVNKKDYKIKGYKVNGSDATSAAEGDEVEITIEGSGSNYTGEATATYHVIAKANDISKAKAGKIADKTYTGSRVTLKDSDLTNLLTLNGKTLVPGTDFEVAGYDKNIKKGTAKVTLKGIDNGETVYGGLKTVTFKIVQKKGTWKNGGNTLIDGEWK